MRLFEKLYCWEPIYSFIHDTFIQSNIQMREDLTFHHTKRLFTLHTIFTLQNAVTCEMCYYTTLTPIRPNPMSLPCARFRVCILKGPVKRGGAGKSGVIDEKGGGVAS